MIRPKVLILESTNRCNGKCIFCWHEHQKIKLGDMSLDLCEKLIYESEAKFVWFHLFGEPTLCPTLESMVESASVVGARSGIVTNGFLLSPELCEKLMCAGLNRIIISLGGSDKETYEKMWGLKYEQTWQNARSAISLSRHFKTRVTIRFILTEENIHQKWAMFRYWIKHTSDLHFVREFKVPFKERNSIRRITRNCKLRRRLTRECAVKWNGTVALCCMDLDASMNLGDASKEHLLKIFNGEKMNRMRDAVYKGIGEKPEICKSCDIFPKGFKRLF